MIKDGEFDTGSGWRDPETGGGAGRGAGAGDSFRRVMGRIFGDAEHPLGWGVTVGRLFGVRIRLHLALIVYVLAQVAWSIPRDELGVAYLSMLMAGLLLVILVHDLGHVAACRRMGGEADDVLLWPLGGLAPTHPPDGWRPRLLVALAGPAVNVMIAIGTTIGLAMAGHADTALANPFHINATLALFDSYAVAALWALHYVNLVVLALNLALPMHPLDGATVLQTILWKRSGDEHRSAEVAAVTGIAVGVGLGVLAVVAERTLLIGVAVFGVLMSVAERQRLGMVDEIVGDAWRVSLRDEPENAERPDRAEQREAERAARRQEELDDILAKIARTGMDSLTRRERRLLKEETEARKRRG